MTQAGERGDRYINIGYADATFYTAERIQHKRQGIAGGSNSRIQSAGRSLTLRYDLTVPEMQYSFASYPTAASA